MHMQVYILHTSSVRWFRLYFSVISLRFSRDVKCTCDYSCKNKVTVASLWQLMPLLWRCERLWGCVRGQSSAPTSRRNYAHSIRCPSLALTFCVGLVIVRRDGGMFFFATFLGMNKHHQQHAQRDQESRLGDSFQSNATSNVLRTPFSATRARGPTQRQYGTSLAVKTRRGRPGDRWHISRNFRS